MPLKKEGAWSAVIFIFNASIKMFWVFKQGGHSKQGSTYITHFIVWISWPNFDNQIWGGVEGARQTVGDCPGWIVSFICRW